MPNGVNLGAAASVVDGDLPGDQAWRDLVGDQDEDIDELMHGRQSVPRIRPILVALTARAAGANAVDSDVQHVAELLHAALVVHDVALGREGGLRRRVARKLVRRSVDWLGMNHLTLRAMEVARPISPEILGDLIDTLREFSDGQALCQQILGGVFPDDADWAEHADAHTGALFGFCCKAGGRIAGAPAPTQRALQQYGRHLGRLWHIAEDISSLVHEDGHAHLLLRAGAGRPVLAVVRAARRDPEIEEAWAAMLNDPAAGEALVQRVIAAGGVGLCREVMAQEGWQARKALRALPESRYRTALEALVSSLVRCGA